MAEGPVYTNYQLSATSLNTMKEAAGNYMPDYGNWRFISPPPEPEPEPEPKPEPKPDPIPGPHREPDPELKTFSDEEGWGEEGTEGVVVEGEGRKGYKEVYDKMSEAEQAEHGSLEDFIDESEAWWEEHPDEYEAYKRKSDGYTTEGTPGNKGGVKRTGNIDADGTYIDIKEEYHGAPKPEDFVSTLPSTFQKRSPYKMDEGEPHPNTGVRPGSFADPLSGGELKAARQAIIDRGSTASTHYHDQSKEIVKDIKANIFQKEGDDKTKKDNQTRAHVIMKQLSAGIQNLFGAEGAVENFIGLIDEGNVSEGFRNKGVMAKILKGDPDVRLGVTPENNIVLQVPGLNGEPMAISASDINDMTEKAPIQYGFGAKVRSGYRALADAGRSGLPFDSEAVKIESRRLLKDLGPNGLASVLGDKGIITDEPLIKHAADTYWADTDVDPWELIHETMQTEEGEANALELGVEAMVNTARNKHAVEYAEFEKENKGAPTELSAAELIKKYA